MEKGTAPAARQFLPKAAGAVLFAVLSRGGSAFGCAARQPGWFAWANQFRFALRRPRNSPAAHSSVSAPQTSAWVPSPVLGEAAAGAA